MLLKVPPVGDVSIGRGVLGIAQVWEKRGSLILDKGQAGETVWKPQDRRSGYQRAARVECGASPTKAMHQGVGQREPDISLDTGSLWQEKSKQAPGCFTKLKSVRRATVYQFLPTSPARWPAGSRPVP